MTHPAIGSGPERSSLGVVTDADSDGTPDRWQFLAWVPIFLRHPVQDRWMPVDQLLHRRPLRWVTPAKVSAWVCQHRDAIEDRQIASDRHSDVP